MGITTGYYCQCLRNDKEKQITIGVGDYSYKKGHIPYNEKNQIYYGKDENYDINIKGFIGNSNIITKKGINNYTNGNVNIIVPCPTNN